MQIVAGLSLKSIEPRVWDRDSPYFLPSLRAVMISYADIHQAPAVRRRAMEQGLHAALGVPAGVRIFLDNGSFFFSLRGLQAPTESYEEFAMHARPDWRPIPQDFIPTPQMTLRQQRSCLRRTMAVNLNFKHDGYVPVIHISRVLPEYVAALKANRRLKAKPDLALGGIVPNLLRAPKALSYDKILASLKTIRRQFAGKNIHVFGIGGTATLHLAALLGMDSVDSSGWRNRAARGVIQLPGSGERSVVKLGSWKGRELSRAELSRLTDCACPACQRAGVVGLKASGVRGFRNRATHNLWILLAEVNWIERHLAAGNYADQIATHLNNSVYQPLIAYLVSDAAKESSRCA